MIIRKKNMKMHMNNKLNGLILLWICIWMWMVDVIPFCCDYTRTQVIFLFALAKLKLINLNILLLEVFCVCMWWKCVHSILCYAQSVHRICNVVFIFKIFEKLCNTCDCDVKVRTPMVYTHEQHSSQMNTTTISSNKKRKNKITVLENQN